MIGVKMNAYSVIKSPTSMQPMSVSELTVKVFFRKGPPGVCSSSGLTCLFRTIEKDTKNCLMFSSVWKYCAHVC